jgi:VWFA-related protein
MRSTLIAAVVAISVTAAAQQQQQPPPTFRSGVTLVAVDVTVLDKDGRPVPGLTADDFQIKLNGRIQPVRTLSFVQVTEPALAQGVERDPVPESAGGRSVVSNAVASKDPKIFVLAVDDLSFPPEGARRTLMAAQRFVQDQPADVLVGLTTTSGSVAVNPTLDRAAMVNALKHVSGSFIDPRRQGSPESPSVGITEAMEIADHNNSSVQRTVITRECPSVGPATEPDSGGGTYSTAISQYATKCATDVLTESRLIATLVQGTTNRQIASLASALGAMKGAPGLKQMVVLSQGVATTQDFMTLYEPVTKSASAAGVQLSFLMDDDDDLDMSVQDKGVNAVRQQVRGSAASATRREDRRMFIAAMQVLASATGGTFERVITNPAGAFTRAALAGSAVYRLGVEAPAGASASKPLEVSAAVARNGLTLYANHNAMLPDAAATESAAEKVTAAVKHGKPFYAVPMRVAVARRRASGDQVELGVGIFVPGSVAGPLHVTIGVMDAAGGLREGTRTVPAPGSGGDYRLTVPMPVAPGKYRVRLAIEDAAGAVGSVESLVDAGLTTMGVLRSSDLLTWWKDASGRPQFLALDDVPRGVTTLNAGLELYKPAGAVLPPDLKVRLSLFAAGTAAAIAEIDLTPRQEGDVLRAESSLPLASLGPGAYVIRAAVSGGGQPLGEVSATIRKN